MIVVTHPDNEKVLEGISSNLHVTTGKRLEVRYVDIIPSRNIVEHWKPPVDKFIEYDESDEEWLKYCKLGTFTYEDTGPLFYFIDDSKFMDFTNFEPPITYVDYEKKDFNLMFRF